MNSQLLEQARAAYRAGDYSGAVQFFTACKGESEVSGEVDHLRGNALMRLGLVHEAADAYAQALLDTAYGKRGALLTNRGKALSALGDNAGAIACFTEATQDNSYSTPYKAYLGLGRALLAEDRVAEAGTAFRQAAIDGANPAPASALGQLGACFVKLGRPADAVESYRTALDFAGPRDDTRSLNAGLGCAYSACGRHTEAAEAFRLATADGIYQLTPEQLDAQAVSQDALDAASAKNAMAPVGGQEVGGLDPLDPLGKSGQFMPDPSDTGFFTLTESEMIQQDRQNMKIRRKHRHTGLKVFLVILILLIAAAGGLAFAYTRGFGFPSQQDALTGLFDAVTDGGDTDQYLAPGLSDSARSQIVASIPEDATPTITNMDQSMTESTALVTVELPRGGQPTYEVTFVRNANHVGWAVASIEMQFEASSDEADDAGDAAADEAQATEQDAASTDTAEEPATEEAPVE
ncbi:tetratricopeptide repeat protein [Enorma burkinafasonensis]|uniref:tetratricopeptide repeat protein n=1 Tax=Enorma burkinafasonensis TaxID=2590867 RepID=UPI0011A3021D|nr:tetratricopeptide repeat protein [Enorma burkinafasonensis]